MPTQGFWTSAEQYHAFLELTGFSVREIESIATNWNRSLGMMGWELMEFLGYFYSPNLSLIPKPATADIEGRARSAIFWQDISGIRIITKPTSLKEAIGSDGQCLRETVGYAFREPLLSRIGPTYWDQLWQALDRFGYLQRRLAVRILDDLRQGMATNDLWDDFWKCLGGSLAMTLFYAGGFLIVGDETKPFHYLLDFWRSGNLPIGLNRQKELVILVLPDRTE